MKCLCEEDLVGKYLPTEYSVRTQTGVAEFYKVAKGKTFVTLNKGYSLIYIWRWLYCEPVPVFICV